MRRACMIAASAAAALSVTLIAVPSAQADPDVTADEVKKAFAKVEATSEQVNGIKEDIKTAKADIASVRKDITRLREKYQTQRDDLSAVIVSQLMNQPGGQTFQLMSSEKPGKFIDGLSALQALSSSQADRLDTFAASAAELQNREKHLKGLTRDLNDNKAEAAAKAQKMKTRYEEVKADYDRLTAQEQEVVDGGPHTSEPEVDTSSIKATGRVKDAIAFAMAHVGDSYVWGGNGPHAWDCSGLTMAAYKAAGVNIGRVTYDQVKQGKGVSMNSLQAGDLVFFSDLSHVGIYVGNGKVVNAARPGVGVVVSGVSGYSIARRIG